MVACQAIVPWVRFDDPWWLLGLAVAVAPVGLARWARRRGRHVGAAAVGLQCLAVALAAAALAGPSVRLGGRSRQTWLVLQDVSASTRGQDANLTGWPAEGSGVPNATDRVGVPSPPRSIAAGRPDLPRQTVRFAETIIDAATAPLPPPTRTRVAPALQLAAARWDELAGVVVITDGQFHDPQWEDAARALGRAGHGGAPAARHGDGGLRVMVVPLDRPPADARVADLWAQRRPDGGVELRVAVACNAAQVRRLTVRREGAAEPLLARDLALMAGEEYAVRLTDESAAAEPRQAITYRAGLSPGFAQAKPGDGFAENDEAAVAVPPRQPTVALLTADGADPPGGLGRHLGAPLRQVAPADAPRGAAGWWPHSAVVLVDPRGDSLDGPQRAALAQYVRAGGGLVILGTGPASAPRDRLDPLNAVAALVANPYERRPLKALVVLDSSGSMSEAGPDGRRKIDLAVEAVRALRSHLTDRDALAVITFSDSWRLVYDSGAGPPDFAALGEALRTVQPGGPTVVAPALEQASASPPPPGREGLVLLATDLATQAFDPAAMADRFRTNRLSLSVVAIRSGAEPQPALLRLAEQLSCPLVHQEDLAGLAEVFARFLRTARGDVIRRGQFRPAPGAVPSGPEGPLRGDDPPAMGDYGALPPLDAYVLSALQENAEASLFVERDPVVARRRAGLGRCVSLAIPFGPGENAAWRESDVFGRQLAAVTRWAMRPEGDWRYSADVRPEPAGWRLVVRCQAAPEDRPAELTARLAPDDDSRPPQDIPLVQTAPGRYEGRLPASSAGSAEPSTPSGGSQPAAVQVVGPDGRVLWSGSYGGLCAPEFAAIGPNWANLRRLAALCGGRLVSLEDLPATGRRLSQGRHVPVWPVLLGLAAAAMLLEWSLTRVRRHY